MSWTHRIELDQPSWTSSIIKYILKLLLIFKDNLCIITIKLTVRSILQNSNGVAREEEGLRNCLLVTWLLTREGGDNSFYMYHVGLRWKPGRGGAGGLFISLFNGGSGKGDGWAGRRERGGHCQAHGIKGYVRGGDWKNNTWVRRGLGGGWL